MLKNEQLTKLWTFTYKKTKAYQQQSNSKIHVSTQMPRFLDKVKHIWAQALWLLYRVHKQRKQGMTLRHTYLRERAFLFIIIEKKIVSCIKKEHIYQKKETQK